ncbi:unnamed protein product [Tuber aestivum]|uniref:Uncharacterized protein n=1 Tax=Tuber aestivum TaxID=59557 RepID=A0A292Q7P1_9PEZI|nr:unnamed protein product [Tuber aestivum]
MDPESVSQQSRVVGMHRGGPQNAPERAISRKPKLVMGISGVTWAKTKSCQPPDPAFDTTRHQKITHALLVELGASDLIPTPVPKDIRNTRQLLEYEDFESLKRIERNRLIYPERLSPVEETLFMTARKKAMMPSYIRTRVESMYRSSGGSLSSIENDPEEDSAEEIGVGKVRLFPLGGDRPGKPRHRLDLWKPKPAWEE